MRRSGDLQMVLHVAAADEKWRLADGHVRARTIRGDELENNFADGWGIGHVPKRDCTTGLGSLRAGTAATQGSYCGVEVWRGGLGGTYRLPALSSAGASLVPPCFRFHTPLIEPDVRICRIRLSEKTHAIAIAIACDAVCNF